ncbi:MAG TPA: FAD-binding oxidoreductase, partial [Verrucomicrobiae bacterium]|nr:FAD-binding oxidoreductase [Verrucomicrobiae bacterium]
MKILEHTPEDLTATVEAGITLVTLQTELARHRQWLPVDPPHPERLTIAELIDRNLSGPRRFGYGTVRDHLIGIKVALTDGTIIHSGGKVVKNVAGYDLMKLFIGARESLGTVLETTFKLHPLPEMERIVQTRCETLEQADKAIEMVMHSDLAPVVLDLVNAEC